MDRKFNLENSDGSIDSQQIEFLRKKIITDCITFFPQKKQEIVLPTKWTFNPQNLLSGNFPKIICHLLWQKLEKYQPRILISSSPIGDHLASLLSISKGIPLLTIRQYLELTKFTDFKKTNALKAAFLCPMIGDSNSIISTQTSSLPLGSICCIGTIIDGGMEDSIRFSQSGIPLESLFYPKDLGLVEIAIPLTRKEYVEKWCYGTFDALQKSRPFFCIDNGRIHVKLKNSIKSFTFEGEELWKHAIDQSITDWSGPILINEFLFLLLDHTLLKISKNNGALASEKKLSFGKPLGLYPDEKKSKIYASFSASDHSTTIAGISASSLEVEWIFSFPSTLSCPPCILEEEILLPTSELSLIGISKEDGKITDTLNLASKILSITPSNSLLFLSFHDGEKRAITLKEKDIVWKNESGSTNSCDPLLGNASIFFGNNSFQLTSYDQKTGKINWHFLSNGPISSLMLSDEHTISLLAENRILIVDELDGKLLGDFIFKSTPLFQRFLGDKYLLLAFTDGFLRVYQENIKPANESEITALKKAIPN